MTSPTPSSAEQVAQKIYDDWNAEFTYCLNVSSAGKQLLVDMITLAIKQERERIARLVETWADDNKTIQPSFTKIAAAIRKGEG